MESSIWRARLLFVAAIVTSALLAGCQTDGPTTARHLQPLSPQMLALLEQKNMSSGGPILVRIFKEESELEVWKQDRSGRMALLKSYPICRWSGELGPKVREGDRQAPEGFYTVTPGQMNPNSSLYLSFNLGYPNTFDQAYGRTGSYLMVHGDCSSRGCYSLTDEQISEVYALGREAFFAGQKAFQVQAYPFRMTPQNLARHRNNPNLPFWRNLKEGYDHFEVARMEPKVNVCERRYVFNARAAGSSALRFEPAGQCPTYEIPQELASALATKKQQDDLKTAEYVKAGTPSAPIKTNTDGGMHSVFLAKVKSDGGAEESTFKLSFAQNVPGTIPAHVNPPGVPKPVWAAESVSRGPQPAAPNSFVAKDRSVPATATASQPLSHGSVLSVPKPASRVADAMPAQNAASVVSEPSTTILPGDAFITPAAAFNGHWMSTVR